MLCFCLSCVKFSIGYNPGVEARMSGLERNGQNGLHAIREWEFRFVESTFQ
jgi:hypothetical protein